jgi:hypothetical protein
MMSGMVSLVIYVSKDEMSLSGLNFEKALSYAIDSSDESRIRASRVIVGSSLSISAANLAKR